MNHADITVVVNNSAKKHLVAEHGLSLAIRWQSAVILLDTGAGTALPANMRLLDIKPDMFDHLLISHGHNDHTGCVDYFLASNDHASVCYGSGVQSRRFACRAKDSVGELTFPENCFQSLTLLSPDRRRCIDSWTCLVNGLYLTGPIPRISGEDTGGPFFLDREGTIPDLIMDELALLITTASGNVLVTGCCHAGLINTLEHCRNHGFQVKTVLGGLHLKDADSKRLAHTVSYLNDSPVRTLYPLHCTGSNAMEYLSNHFTGQMLELQAGNTIEL